MQTVRTGGGQVAVSFFVLGLLILLGVPQLLPAFYRTITEPEKDPPTSDEERLERVREGLRSLQLFATRSIKQVGQLFIIALGVAGVGVVDEEAAKVLAGLILFLLVIQDWEALNTQLEGMSVPQKRSA